MRHPKRALLACLVALGCAQDPETEGTTQAATTDAGTTSSTTQMGTSQAATTTETTTDGTADTAATTGDADCPAGLEPAATSTIEACGDPIGEPLCSEGQAHIPPETPIEWTHNPPHSGPHDPMWAVWGEHEQTLPRRNWVHNLEHGGIVLAYLCAGGCEAELAVLRQVLDQRPDLRIILTQDPELAGERFAAISWTWVYRFDAPDLETLLCFADQHENHAPEDVP